MATRYFDKHNRQALSQQEWCGFAFGDTIENVVHREFLASVCPPSVARSAGLAGEGSEVFAYLNVCIVLVLWVSRLAAKVTCPYILQLDNDLLSAFT